MLVRKLQKNDKHDSYIACIPKGIVEVLKLTEGQRLQFTVDNGKEIRITPLKAVVK